MDSLRIALVSEEFPPYTFGGIGAVCSDLANSLSKLGIGVTVFCGRSSKIIVERPLANLEVVRLPFADIPPRFLWFQLQNFPFFYRQLKNFDLIHLVNPQAGMTAAHISDRFKLPLVSSLHGTALSNLKIFAESPFSYWTLGDIGNSMLEYPLNALLTQSCIRNSDYIVACSRTVLNDMQSVGGILDPDRFLVIHNGIDFQKIKRAGEGLRASNTAGYSIVYFGRLYWCKGVIHLVRAMEKLTKTITDATLQIFGKGPLEKKIRAEVAKLGLEKNVNIRGYSSREMLIGSIKNADVIAIPSLYEAQPVAALEAMACRKPIVAYDFPFMREFIRDLRTGLLAKAASVNDFSDKLHMLLTDRRLARDIGKNAFEYVQKNHNWDLLAKEYLRVYELAIACKNKTRRGRAYRKI